MNTALIFLIAYIFFVLVYIIYSLVGIYHLRRFGYLGDLTKLVIFVYSVVSFSIIIISLVLLISRLGF